MQNSPTPLSAALGHRRQVQRQKSVQDALNLRSVRTASVLVFTLNPGDSVPAESDSE